jgi:hypothetical protein
MMLDHMLDATWLSTSWTVIFNTSKVQEINQPNEVWNSLICGVRDYLEKIRKIIHEILCGQKKDEIYKINSVLLKQASSD